MIAAALVCCPHSLHTTWKGTACCNNSRIFIDHSADCCKCCCLCDLSVCHLYEFRNRSWISCLDDRLEIISCIFNACQADHFFVPCFFGFFDFSVVCRYIATCTKFLGKCFYCNLCISDCFCCIHLVSVESAVVDCHEFYIRILEQSLGACCEV